MNFSTAEEAEGSVPDDVDAETYKQKCHIELTKNIKWGDLIVGWSFRSKMRFIQCTPLSFKNLMSDLGVGM